VPGAGLERRGRPHGVSGRRHGTAVEGAPVLMFGVMSGIVGDAAPKLGTQGRKMGEGQ
jgi:hypothetical protein